MRRIFDKPDRVLRPIFDKQHRFFDEADQKPVSINHQETAQIAASGFLKHSARNWPNSRLRFSSASFYKPEPYCIYPFLSVTHSLSLRVSPSLSVCHGSSDSCPLFSFLRHRQTLTYTISPHFLSLRLARFLTLPVWLTLLHFLFSIPGKGQGPGKEDLEREIFVYVHVLPCAGEAGG